MILTKLSSPELTMGRDVGVNVMKTAEQTKPKAAIAPSRHSIDYQSRDVIGSLYFLWLSILVLGYLWMVCLPK